MLQGCLRSFISTFCSLSLGVFLSQLQHFCPLVFLLSSAALLIFSLLLFSPLLPCLFSSLLLKRAADVEEEEELQEKAADSVLLKLESGGQGPSIRPSASDIRPFVHQPTFSAARRNSQSPRGKQPPISILELLCSREGRVRGETRPQQDVMID